MLQVSTGTAENAILRCFHRGLCGFPLLTGDAPHVVVNAVGRPCRREFLEDML